MNKDTKEKANIYKKLSAIRLELQDKKLKKSGKNKFAGYEYYELRDIIPAINDLNNKYNLVSVIKYQQETATLTIINSDNSEEKVEFISPMSTANLKGCHDVQNLGAVETYIRRYLYITAYEIVEDDALDSTHNKNDDSLNKGQTDDKKWLYVTYKDGKINSTGEEIKKQLQSGKTSKEVIEMAEKKYKVYKETKEIIKKWETEVNNDEPFPDDMNLDEIK